MCPSVAEPHDRSLHERGARPLTSRPHLRIEVLTRPEQFYALGPAWDDLYARAGLDNIFMRFDWHRRAWDAVGAPGGLSLRVLVGRSPGAGDAPVALIWPLVRDRSYLRSLASNTVEYRDILLAPGADADHWLAAAWETVGRLPGVHCLLLQDIRQDSQIARMLRQTSAAGAMTTTPSRYVRLDRFGTLPAFLATLPKHMRADQRRQWRRLAAQGTVQFQCIEDEVGLLTTLDWLFEHKLRWLEVKGMPTGKFRSAAYRAFITDVCRSAHAKGELIATALTVDGRIISAGFGFRLGPSFLFYMFAYDPAWASYSPSRLYLERLIGLCLDERLLVFDFMPGDMAYKEIWCDASVQVTDYFIPLSRLGTGLVGWHASGLVRRMEGGWAQWAYGRLPAAIRKPITRRLLAHYEYAGRLRRFSSAEPDRSPR